MHKVVLKIILWNAILAWARGSWIAHGVRAKGILKSLQGGVVEITTGVPNSAIAVIGAGKAKEMPVTTNGGGT